MRQHLLWGHFSFLCPLLPTFLCLEEELGLVLGGFEKSKARVCLWMMNRAGVGLLLSFIPTKGGRRGKQRNPVCLQAGFDQTHRAARAVALCRSSPPTARPELQGWATSPLTTRYQHHNLPGPSAWCYCLGPFLEGHCTCAASVFHVDSLLLPFSFLFFRLPQEPPDLCAWMGASGSGATLSSSTSSKLSQISSHLIGILGSYEHTVLLLSLSSRNAFPRGLCPASAQKGPPCIPKGLSWAKHLP